MCNRCGNFDNWNNATNCCSCGCKQRKGDKGEPGVQGKPGTFPANVFSAAPLMTAAEIVAYPNPSAGLVAYNTTTNQFYGYTTSWKPLGGGANVESFSINNPADTATQTVSTSFKPKIIFVEIVGQATNLGSLGFSVDFNNVCFSNTAADEPSGASYFCGSIITSGNGFTLSAQNFTDTSFDLTWTKVGIGVAGGCIASITSIG